MYRLCQHTMATGLRCKCPALRTDDFCYYHTAFRRQQRELADENSRPPEFVAPNFNMQGDSLPALIAKTSCVPPGSTKGKRTCVCPL